METGWNAIIATPFGHLGIRCGEAGIESVDFLGDSVPVQPPDSPLAARAVAQLQAYLDDPRERFDLPLAPAGTAFQQRVWALMRAIPPGQARSYGSVAAELGSSARAIGGACRANPVPILVPCHRIVAAAGFGGFNGERGGHDLAVKRWLLAHEGFELA